MPVREALLEWYRPRAHAYPWRRSRPDPYSVLVSEVMLQQTQAARVAPAYRTFLRRFPTVQSLAQADRADVVRTWNGLGYNRRAVALSEAARAIVRDQGARVPADPAELERLPGVGPYTAAAISSIGYRVPIPALDTNVRRVVSRVSFGLEPHEARPSQIRQAADQLLDRTDPGRWNQAVMDLGRIVCRPVPRCAECPIAPGCRYREMGRPGIRRTRSQPAYGGSFRQLRGAVVEELRDSGSLTMAELTLRTDRPIEQVLAAVSAMHDEGLVRANRAALERSPRGRVTLG